MSRKLLLVASLLVSLHSSHSRPQTFFSRRNQGFSRSSQQTPFRGSFLSVIPSSGPGDIIEQTRTQADTLKNTLRSLARKPEAAPILEKVFAGNNNDCINNMDEAIEAIETSTRTFENAGTEMKQLVEAVKEFQNIHNAPKAVRQAAKIIRLFDVLIPKLTPPTSACKSTSTDVFQSMRSLESFVLDLSSKDDLYYTPQVRQSLKSSAQILSKVTALLTKESHFKFDHFCTKDKEHNKEFITAVSKMMSDLADLYTDLGGDIAAQELRKQEAFAKKLAAKMDKLGDLSLVSLDCASPGSTELVAKTMEDLAGLIEDIGMENLCRQLDLDSADCTP